MGRRVATSGLVTAVAVAALTACDTSNTAGPPGGHPFRSCPTGTQSTIDRPDFFAWAGIRYLAVEPGVGRPLAQGDLGGEYARVRCSLDGDAFGTSFDEMQDGNATALGVGTPMYAVNGYMASFRLAAHAHGSIVLYEADTNPAARTGRDLLDVAGRVVSIDVDRDMPTTKPLATIRDAAEVDSLVAMLLSAPVRQTGASNSSAGSYAIVLRLRDGTVVLRGYARGTGELGRGIMTPPAFQAAIERAVSASA